MIVPVGQERQSLCVLDKDSKGTVSRRDILDVVYVPLTSKEQQVHRFG
jgi:protein-L-isoaspartate(D-aspartate) O-methyltransferase